MNQIELHKQIDALLAKDPAEVKPGEVSALISVNEDVKQWFYHKADERWLSWLWEKGFLNAIKTPELNYLVKVAGKEPKKIVDIMLVVPISAENFNPEVVDRFLQICSALPAKELKRIVGKIHDEKWPQLMSAFKEWGFEYEEMFQTLAKANDFDSLLILAEAVLSVRTKEEFKQISRGFSPDNPFYFNDLSYTKVFEYLLKVDELNIEKALELVTNTISQIVLLGRGEEKDEVFEVYDRFFLLDDVDIFTLELEKRNGLSRRDDVKNLAAVIKQYAERTIGKECSNIEFATKLYGKYFEPLSDSRSMWRLRLFVLSLCPEAFKDELKKSFFRLFDVERYHELILGTEYQRALSMGFAVLSEGNKREYVKQIIGYFVKKDKEKKNDKEDWHIKYGSNVLSMIADQLTEEEKRAAQNSGFTLDPNYKPEPTIGQMHAGTIVSRGPITKEEFGNLSIAEIAKKLRVEWTPEELRKQNSSDDFFNPRNAEGAGEWLRMDISKRLQDYINNANLFFERDVLDQHYTYSFLRGIEETFRENKANVGDINWDGLMNLCVAIVQSGKNQPFESGARERDTFDAWLSGWEEVHSVMADVVEKLISEDNGKTAIDFLKYRDALFAIIRCLLAYPDPVPEDEKIESAKMKTKSPGSEEYLVSDPYSMAINTVRGRAFQDFALFVYQDGKKFGKEEKLKFSQDVKELYEMVLKKEKTRALMFMFGHYLPSFYFRETEWMRVLLPQIFPVDLDKKDLYLAAWEGYLTTNLYKELFVELQDFYSRAIDLNTEDYTKRRYFKDLDEALATHFALAFIHFSEFGFEHDLFKKFWSTENLKRHKEFVSFIGRYCISREAADEWVKHNKIDIEKLKKFWDWALANITEPEVFSGFGFWINPDKEILDDNVVVEKISQTLEKSDGDIDWDYGLLKRLPIFAQKNGEKSLEIISSYLLDSENNLNQNRRVPMFSIDNEIKEALRVIYKNDDEAMKQKVTDLINTLIEKGSSMFWGLKEVINEDLKRI